MWKIENLFNNKWFIFSRDNSLVSKKNTTGSIYLHKDGIIRQSTLSDNYKEYTGLFDTFEEANMTLKKFNESTNNKVF